MYRHDNWVIIILVCPDPLHSVSIVPFLVAIFTSLFYLLTLALFNEITCFILLNCECINLIGLRNLFWIIVNKILKKGTNAVIYKLYFPWNNTLDLKWIQVLKTRKIGLIVNASIISIILKVIRKIILIFFRNISWIP